MAGGVQETGEYARRVRQVGSAGLYGILDMGYVDEGRMERVAAELLHGGVGVLQLRAKGYSPADVVGLVRRSAPGLAGMCREHGVPLIVNDFPEVAVELGADGVHVGQDDGALADVRDVVGGEMIVGRSTHSPEQARQALRRSRRGRHWRRGLTTSGMVLFSRRRRRKGARVLGWRGWRVCSGRWGGVFRCFVLAASSRRIWNWCLPRVPGVW